MSFNLGALQDFSNSSNSAKPAAEKSELEEQSATTDTG